jgi:uncharacterized protein (DUF433 family)
MKSGNQNVFELPAYGCNEAARYVGLPSHTLRHWISDAGLIRTPAPNVLSWNNLAEAHVLKAMRKVHHLPMQGIRKALRELGNLRATQHPLLDESFETDGVNLCIREEDRIVNLSKHRQQEIKDFVAIYLHRIRRERGVATQLFPFIVADTADEPQSISISPKVSFGKPVLAGTGVSTSVIVGRFKARDSLSDLAREYEVSEAVLEDAVRWEFGRAEAA